MGDNVSSLDSSISVSDLTPGTALRAPDGDFAVTDGGKFTVKKKDIYSGKYTLLRSGSKFGVPDTLQVHEGALLNGGWELA